MTVHPGSKPPESLNLGYVGDYAADRVIEKIPFIAEVKDASEIYQNLKKRTKSWQGQPGNNGEIDWEWELGYTRYDGPEVAQYLEFKVYRDQKCTPVEIDIDQNFGINGRGRENSPLSIDRTCRFTNYDFEYMDQDNCNTCGRCI